MGHRRWCRARGRLPAVHPRLRCRSRRGGAAAGKARQLHHRKELTEELQDAIAPGHSGILALVSDPGAVEIRKALDKADAIVEKALDKAAAEDIKAAAAEAEAEADKA